MKMNLESIILSSTLEFNRFWRGMLDEGSDGQASRDHFVQHALIPLSLCMK